MQGWTEAKSDWNVLVKEDAILCSQSRSQTPASEGDQAGGESRFGKLSMNKTSVSEIPQGTCPDDGYSSLLHQPLMYRYSSLNTSRAGITDAADLRVWGALTVLAYRNWHFATCLYESEIGQTNIKMHLKDHLRYRCSPADHPQHSPRRHSNPTLRRYCFPADFLHHRYRPTSNSVRSRSS